MDANHQVYYAAHVTEMQSRWEEALEAEEFGAVLVHSGTPLVSFLDDYEYTFRPNPHFLAWLPLTRHHDSALLIAPGRRPRLFYYQPVDYWYLPPEDPAPWWGDHFDIQIVRDAEGWGRELGDVLRAVSLEIGDIAAIGDSPALKAHFDQDRINPDGLVTRLHLQRTRKTRYEIACMKEASAHAALGHAAAEAAFRAGEPEFGIHMRYLEACGQTDAALPYGSIVALNSHGAVLHYQGREREAPAQRHSFLIDAGASVNAYAADVTRTYAAEEGAFADLVAAMDEVQQDLAGRVAPGVDYRQLHLLAHSRIASVLEAAGIIRVKADEAVETGLSGVFFPHGLGHFLGLQTHDVAGLVGNDGQAIARPHGHPYLRLTRVLEPGNVLTIEPGLYFIEPLLRHWREQREPGVIDWERVEQLAPCGGIRIEDNVVVTETGCENLTREAFAKL